MSGDPEVLGIVYHPDYLIHTDPHHPERKERLEHIWQKIDSGNLKDNYTVIQPEPADIDTISLVHELGYIESVEKACKQNVSGLDMDTYIVPESYEVALLSAGGAVRGLEEVMEGRFRRVFCLNRPPGHHAEDNRAMGFCIFNNIAIAARVAQKKYGLNRIAIVDWDVHHGNGTQHEFAADKEVLFFSVHQSPNFPGTGSIKETGRGEGEGYTINVPLPPGCGDSDYLKAFKEILVPVMQEFQPQLLMLSAGQDAYHLDPLASMKLTIRGYYEMASMLGEIADEYANGRFLSCLEGGYHLEGQAEVILQAMNALGTWNLPVPNENGDSYTGEMSGRKINEVKEAQKHYWRILQ